MGMPPPPVPINPVQVCYPARSCAGGEGRCLAPCSGRPSFQDCCPSLWPGAMKGSALLLPLACSALTRTCALPATLTRAHVPPCRLPCPHGDTVGLQARVSARART